MGRYLYRKSYSWDASLAYFTGLIASDGCLYNDNRHINITSKDIELIQLVKSIIGTTAKIGVKLGQFQTCAFSLTFSNVALYDFLLNTGITSAKSKTIKSVIIPDNFYVDFLRGYFDGDGTTFGYKDSRWKNSHMFYVGFISASQEFLQWLQETNRRLLITKLGVIRPKPRSFELRYAKNDSQSLFSAMYYNGHSKSLSRKYLKLKSFIDSDPYAKITVNARVVEW